LLLTLFAAQEVRVVFRHAPVPRHVGFLVAYLLEVVPPQELTMLATRADHLSGHISCDRHVRFEVGLDVVRAGRMVAVFGEPLIELN
jgi:hypothetical protein